MGSLLVLWLSGLALVQGDEQARVKFSARHALYNLSTTRGAMSAAQVGTTQVAFAGGNVPGQPKGSPLSTLVDIFDVHTKVWSVAHLPHGRGGDSTTGGWLDQVGLAFFGSGGGDSGSVDVFNPKNNSWAPSLPTSLVHEFTACAGTGQTVVCAGGQGHGDEKHDQKIAFATDVFVLFGNGSVTHDSTHQLSVARKKVSAAAQNDIIGFAMGYSDNEETKGYSNAFDLYNTTSGQWSSGVLPSGEARQYGTAVGCGGMLIFAGGQIGGGRSRAVDILDTKTGRWSNATLSEARSNLAAACASNRFALIAGGQIPPRSTVDVLDTSTGVWGTLDPLNFGRGWLVGAGVGNCAVFAGGGQGNESSVDEYCFDSLSSSDVFV